jgi:hypothetical protein
MRMLALVILSIVGAISACSSDPLPSLEVGNPPSLDGSGPDGSGPDGFAADSSPAHLEAGAVMREAGHQDAATVLPKVPCVVNGHTVPAAACQFLHEIAFQIIPPLKGTRDEKLTTAARVAWWSLKEGILSLKNPYVYSNCNVPPDKPYGPLETCASGHPWQVGISGSQVPGTKLTTLEGLATQLFPGKTVSQVLEQAAQKAGLDAATTQKVVASTGTLRNSWLLRVGSIGFTNQAPFVTSQCITQSLNWCYSSTWSPSTLYAPNKTAALKSIADIKAIFSSLLP